MRGCSRTDGRGGFRQGGPARVLFSDWRQSDRGARFSLIFHMRLFLMLYSANPIARTGDANMLFGTRRKRYSTVLNQLSDYLLEHGIEPCPLLFTADEILSYLTYFPLNRIGWALTMRKVDSFVSRDQRIFASFVKQIAKNSRRVEFDLRYGCPDERKTDYIFLGLGNDPHFLQRMEEYSNRSREFELAFASYQTEFKNFNADVSKIENSQEYKDYLNRESAARKRCESDDWCPECTAGIMRNGQYCGYCGGLGIGRGGYGREYQPTVYPLPPAPKKPSQPQIPLERVGVFTVLTVY